MRAAFCVAVSPRMGEKSLRTARVCRVCREQYVENGPQACRSHRAMYSGRLLRVAPTDTSDLQYFWDCCGASQRDAPGCTRDWHRSYDDE